MMEQTGTHVGSEGDSGQFVISEQQRARISDNYRAAKAILDQKRNRKHLTPSRTSPPGDMSPCKTRKLISDCDAGSARNHTESSRCNPDETKKISEVGRVPFQEINTNVYMPTLLSPVFPLVSKCKDPKNRVWFTPCNKLASKVNLGEKNDFQEAGTPLLSGDAQLACLEAHDNSRIAASPLVEDFDDSFLHEIDTIVGQKCSERIQSTSAIEGFSGGSKDPHYDKFKRSIFDEYGADCLFDVPNLHVQAMIPLNPPKIFTRKETERLHGYLSSGYVGDPPHVVEKDKPENTANEISQNYTAGQSAGNFADNDSEAKSRCEHITAFSDPSDRSGDEAQVDQDRETCDSFANYLHSLNDMQREAVTCDIAVPLMIVAGPGSGKTSTIVGRVLMLLKEEIAPSNILAMTFTTAAASEMRERIGAYAGKGVAKELMICTFHSFCLQLCRSHHEKLERTADFLIYGTGQQIRAVTEAVRLTEMSRTSGKDFKDQDVGDPSKKDVSAVSCKDKSKKWQKFVAKAKASGKTVEDYQKMGCDLGAKILGHYNEILRSCNALDYYDFISFSLKLLSNFPEVYKYCQDSWKAIVVDEFQDTSTLQYQLLRALASHNHVTVVGDEDQSIFSFNGADISGFDAFRKDFPLHKEVRLQRNYRSTRSIVEASLSLIQHNRGRCSLKKVETDNDPGSKIIVECHTEDAQCSFVIDKILEMTSHNATDNCHFGNISVLYRRQVSGKLFQTSFRSRKIPFNVHGVAFYRKKVTKAIMAILKTSLPGCGDAPYRHAFKALFPGEKSERKMVVDYIDKISAMRKCGFVPTARDVFSAKVSGTFKRNQLVHGRKVLLDLDVISRLVQRERSLSMVVNSVANFLPQKYLLVQRAVIDADGGKLLNEDSDLRTVLHYLLDDVSEFLSSHCNKEEYKDGPLESKGCVHVLQMFIDYVSEREMENFRTRRVDNANSVTLTTIHQSKGLEWDTVFIVKANDGEIPLLNDATEHKDDSCSIEEQRRLLYVAMTRARKKLYILYIVMGTNWQILQPSRFLKELPRHILDIQDGSLLKELRILSSKDHSNTSVPDIGIKGKIQEDAALSGSGNSPKMDSKLTSLNPDIESEQPRSSFGNSYLRRFKMEDRSYVSHLFHSWAKKPAFHDPRRLLNKVRFVIDERLRCSKNKSKSILEALRSQLKCEEAFEYAEYVISWEKMPVDRRMQVMLEKQEHFQKQRIEASMDSSAATSKQISFLQKLGCTVAPTSRLHASRLIEQYKSL